MKKAFYCGLQADLNKTDNETAVRNGKWRVIKSLGEKMNEGVLVPQLNSEELKLKMVVKGIISLKNPKNIYVVGDEGFFRTGRIEHAGMQFHLNVEAKPSIKQWILHVLWESASIDRSRVPVVC